MQETQRRCLEEFQNKLYAVRYVERFLYDTTGIFKSGHTLISNFLKYRYRKLWNWLWHIKTTVRRYIRIKNYGLACEHQ